ncbi:MAG: hypothetical protein RLZZ241_140 [Bacteroidota bacterium]|jgi:acetyl esterase/lipase
MTEGFQWQIHKLLGLKFEVPYRCVAVFFILWVATLRGQEQPQYPPYTVDITFSKLIQEYPELKPIKGLDSTQIDILEDVIYKETPTSDLKLDVYTPKWLDSASEYPAVLLIHGGGWLTGSKENVRIMAQHLAQQGFVGVAVSYRLGFEAPYPAAVLDLKDAVKWVKANASDFGVNTDKIAVLGNSAGAQLATLLGVTGDHILYETSGQLSTRVQAIVNIDGIVSFIHPEAAAESKPGKVSMADIWLGGGKDQNYATWKEASPLEYVDFNTPPILFVNSSQARFHAGREDMLLKLNKFSTYYEVHTLAGSPHSFWMANPWFETTLQHVVHFLQVVFEYDSR